MGRRGVEGKKSFLLLSYQGRRNLTEKLIATYVGSDDRLVQKEPSWVYWLVLSPKTIGTAAELRIYDGYDTSGKEIFRVKLAYSRNINFSPPLNCEQGIYIECVDAFNSYTVAYAAKRWLVAEE